MLAGMPRLWECPKDRIDPSCARYYNVASTSQRGAVRHEPDVPRPREAASMAQGDLTPEAKAFAVIVSVAAIAVAASQTIGFLSS